MGKKDGHPYIKTVLALKRQLFILVCTYRKSSDEVAEIILTKCKIAFSIFAERAFNIVKFIKNFYVQNLGKRQLRKRKKNSDHESC